MPGGHCPARDSLCWGGTNPGIVAPCRVQQAAREAQGLALSSLGVPSVPAACVCFLELLGHDSLRLRVQLRAARLILSHRSSPEASLHHHSHSRDSLGKGAWSDLGWVLWVFGKGSKEEFRGAALLAQQCSKSI